MRDTLEHPSPTTCIKICPGAYFSCDPYPEPYNRDWRALFGPEMLHRYTQNRRHQVEVPGIRGSNIDIKQHEPFYDILWQVVLILRTCPNQIRAEARRPKLRAMPKAEDLVHNPSREGSVSRQPTNTRITPALNGTYRILLYPRFPGGNATLMYPFYLLRLLHEPPP